MKAGVDMKRRFLLGVLGCVAFAPLDAPSMAASSENNSTCVGFAGTTGGVKFAGIKCARDIDPGNYAIRYIVKERDDPAQYKALLRVPRKPIRCTLVDKGTMRKGGASPANVTTIDIKSC
jgi:hypothetical protein